MNGNRFTRVDGGNTACSPFDKLRTSSVKNEHSFFSSLLYRVAAALLFCLSLWGFASPAAAATIVVTTLADTADPPFNAPGICGTGTISNLPGADGKVSLREAIIAANNTPGKKSIVFAPSLSGGIIVLTRSLYLCGGHTTLNGDVNGNDTPDITVDGSAVLFPFDVIGLVSSHNTVKNLQVLAPGNSSVSGIAIATTLAVATTVLDNTIAHNSVTGGGISVVAGLDNFNNGQSIDAVTIDHAIVRDNTVLGSSIVALNTGDHNVITDLTIAGNTVSGSTGLAGIFVAGGLQNNDNGASDDRLDVTIKDNTSTGNSFPGDIAGIDIVGGLFSSSHNQVTAQILNNTITNNTGTGLAATAGSFGGSSDNRIDVTMRNNTITGNSQPGGTAGIDVFGGSVDASGNHATADLLDNTITDNNGNGITAIAGFVVSADNYVDARIRGNTLENNAGLGILAFGGLGAAAGNSSGNTLDARIERNTVKNASLFGLWVTGGFGSPDGAPTEVANANKVNAAVTDNTVTGTSGEGMHLEAGGPGEANVNAVLVRVRKNTACHNSSGDIHAIGGLLGNPFLIDNTGEGNILTGLVAHNTATAVTVENGVAGNAALIRQFENVPCP